MLVIPVRIIWQIYPNLWWCIVFWAVVLWLNRPKKRNLQTFLVFVGASFNALATIANGGKMPVLGKYGSPVSAWRAARPSDHLLILCDRIGGFSIGDLLIGASFILGLGLWLWKVRTNPAFLGKKRGHDGKGVSV
jgi:hypothetical protein